MVKRTQIIRRLMPTNCLNVLDEFERVTFSEKFPENFRVHSFQYGIRRGNR